MNKKTTFYGFLLVPQHKKELISKPKPERIEVFIISIVKEIIVKKSNSRI